MGVDVCSTQGLVVSGKKTCFEFFFFMSKLWSFVVSETFQPIVNDTSNLEDGLWS